MIRFDRRRWLQSLGLAHRRFGSRAPARRGAAAAAPSARAARRQARAAVAQRKSVWSRPRRDRRDSARILESLSLHGRRVRCAGGSDCGTGRSPVKSRSSSARSWSRSGTYLSLQGGPGGEFIYLRSGLYGAHRCGRRGRGPRDRSAARRPAGERFAGNRRQGERPHAGGVSGQSPQSDRHRRRFGAAQEFRTHDLRVTRW